MSASGGTVPTLWHIALQSSVATGSARRSRPRHSRWSGRRACDIDTTDFDLGGARYLRDGEILSDAVLDQLRGFDCILLGAVGTPEVPPGVIERGLLLKMRFELDLYINQRPFIGTAPGGTVAARLRRHPREHRGPVRGRGWRAAQGHRARGGHAGLGQHLDGRRARLSLRVRAGDDPPRARHARAQDQRAHLRRRPVAARVQRGRRRLPRRGHRLQPRRRRVHLLRAGPATLRRDRHRQPVRRHPHRPRRGRQRWHRAGQQRQPQPGAHRAQHVRAGARLGPRHRRHGQGQPDGRHPERGADARLPRRERRCRSHPARVRRACYRQHQRDRFQIAARVAG